MAPTSELRAEALTVGDISYTPDNDAEEIVARHNRLLHMLDRLRNPDKYREETAEEKAVNVLFIGDRNTGTTLKSRFSEEVTLTTMASTAGGVAAAQKNDVVLIHLGDEAKERFAFLQMLLKNENRPKLALLFMKPPPDRIKAFCDGQGVALIESKSSDEVESALKSL
jgi:hypothetical protein